LRKNKLGYSAAISLVIANMIGVGIFTSLGFQLNDLNNYYSILLLWLFGGIHAILGSFCYSELSAAFPKSGGEYHFLKISFGNFTGFLSGWTSAILGFAAPITAAAYAFSKYFGHLFLTGFHPTLISILIIVLITIIHCFRINTGARFQVFLTTGKVILIVIFILAGMCLFFQNKYTDIHTNFVFSKQIMLDLFTPGFWVGLIFVSYAYSGWNASAYVIDEVENPKKNVPKSIIIGTLIVTVLYVLLNYVFLIFANADELRGKEDVAYVSAIRIFGNYGALIVSSIISFLLISTISSMVMVGPRVIKRIALDYEEFNYFSSNNKNNVPIKAIILQSSISIILLITSSFEFIVTCIGFVLCIFTTLTSLAVIVLRWKQPNAERPIKVPLYPLTPILFSLFNIWIMVFLIQNKTIESLTGVGFVALGGIVYYLINFNKRGIKIGAAILITCSICSCNNLQQKNIDGELTVAKTDSTIKTVAFKYDSALNNKALLLSAMDTSSFDGSKKLLANNISNSWDNCFHNVLNPITKWMHEEKYDRYINSSTLVFYPFSGPDFAFANSFYPDAKCYIMAGLENAGNLKSNIFSTSKHDSGFLNNAEKYFYFSTKFGFFRTLDMEKQFEEKGVADIIAFYLKRMNCDIETISILNWNSTNKTFATVRDSANGNVCYAKFRQQSGTISELYFFSKNISDEGLSNDSNWLQWVKEKSGNSSIVSLTKSASYLMSVESFSKVRNFILKNSTLHIQDDSGIGFKYITASNRPYTLYGKFTSVIPVFKHLMQNDLALKYKLDSTIKSLPFAIGYNLKFNETNLEVIH
jgi:APA family basic amino acid/polyamine antiporter